MTDESKVLARFPEGYWRVPAYLDYVQPALTDEILAAAEAQLGVKLPSAYVHLLRQQNGGYLRVSSGVSHQLHGIGPRFPSITLDGAWWRPKNAEADMWTPEMAELLIPFDGDGHWDMCFDYRTCGPRGEPSIMFVDCECEREEAIAPRFVDFLAAGVDDEAEAATRIYGPDAETVARAVATHLGVAEPTVDAFAHGYPTWRLAPPGETQWCWCSPNRVPSGFRREGAKLVPTEAMGLRIPEDPRCTALLTCTEESRSSVAAALVALGFVVGMAPLTTSNEV